MLCAFALGLQHVEQAADFRLDPVQPHHAVELGQHRVQRPSGRCRAIACPIARKRRPGGARSVLRLPVPTHAARSRPERSRATVGDYPEPPDHDEEADREQPPCPGLEDREHEDDQEDTGRELEDEAVHGPRQSAAFRSGPGGLAG